jgi:hypothetical protein
MRTRRLLVSIGALVGVGVAAVALGQASPREAEIAAIVARVTEVHGLSADQSAALSAVFAGSSQMGTGNPALTKHPMTREACQAKLAEQGVTWRNEVNEAICGGPYMAPLYDPATQKPADATACIDVLEFPNVPCEYPVVWVRAAEAERACRAIGKRLCDAHEWEGACQGAALPPDYRFDLAAGRSDGDAQKAMRSAHNTAMAADKRWAYGPEQRSGVCAGGSVKSASCSGGTWGECGSNTYPVGAFPECTSPLGVADQHGNAAEHMNLPLAPGDMTSTGSTTLGVTEMKGSWFIWDSYRAHEDWCRWRAPYWHGGRVMDADSHKNYHLGFRCCSDVEGC